MMFEKTGMRNVVALSLLPYGAGPALSVDRCKVIDPTGAPLNIRDAHKNIVGAIRNGRIARAAGRLGRQRKNLGPCHDARRTAARLGLSRVHQLLLIGDALWKPSKEGSGISVILASPYCIAALMDIYWPRSCWAPERGEAGCPSCRGEAGCFRFFAPEGS
jgi:hypothetical protein